MELTKTLFNMKTPTYTAPSGNVYTDTTVTINGKVFKLKRTQLEWDLTKTFNNIKK